MSSVAIIGDIDVVSGFRLGGVKRAEVANSAEEAVAAFDKILDEEISIIIITQVLANDCLLYTSPSPRDTERSRMPSSA